MQENLKGECCTLMAKINGINTIYKRIITNIRTNMKQILIIMFVLVFNHYLVYYRTNFLLDLLYVSYAVVIEIGVLLLVSTFVGRYGRLIYALFFILASFDFALNFGNYLCTKELFTYDSFLLIMGTNSQETSDFLQSYFSIEKIILWVTTLILLYVVYFSYRFKITIKEKGTKILIIIGLSISLLGCATLRYTFFANLFPGKYIHFMYLYEPITDLSEYRQSVKIEETTKKHPSKIMVIIGESFAKSHSSIYEYEKETNPKLATLMKSKNLYSFTHCEAPATRTTLAFKCIMSTYCTSKSTEKKWYECITLNDVFQPMYEMYWISNQKNSGTYNCVQSYYANLCDSVWFSNEEIGQMDCYDEVLLPIIHSLKKANKENKKKPSLVIVNLMGQHEAFWLRYPNKWEHYRELDYLDKPQKQRKALASYDNATLYNDYIVYSIIQQYKDEKAIIFYFPDHGLDLYETDESFFGHAQLISSKSVEISRQIPFFIYVSDSYKQSQPLEIDKIEKSLSKPFNTENFIYSLMDIVGYRFAENDDVETYSLFR